MAHVKRISLALALLFAVSLGIYVQQGLSSRTPPLSIRIAVSQTPLSTPFYVAQHKGYFKDQDIEVELVPYVGGHLCFQALTNGKVDLATTSDSVIMFNSFDRRDFSILSSFVESDNDIKVISPAPLKIREPGQLRGRRVGVIHNTASEFFLHSLLLISGISPQNIELVSLRPDEMSAALISGQIDAASVWEPYAYEALQESTPPPNVINARGMYTLSFNLVSMRPQASNQLTEHRKVLAALGEAIRYIAKQPKETQKIIAQQLQRDPNAIAHSWNDYVFKLSLSNSLISTLESEARWAVSQHRVSAASIPDYRTFIDDTALSATEPAASLIR